ncbi:hypothetical protein BJY52DRAFT_834073 [Lactarius psammicola]|nr:hypothetical protein BJY52DRAFT_834073 [Lactarius psammicola]
MRTAPLSRCGQQRRASAGVGGRNTAAGGTKRWGEGLLRPCLHFRAGRVLHAGACLRTFGLPVRPPDEQRHRVALVLFQTDRHLFRCLSVLLQVNTLFLLVHDLDSPTSVRRHFITLSLCSLAISTPHQDFIRTSLNLSCMSPHRLRLRPPHSFLPLNTVLFLRNHAYITRSCCLPNDSALSVPPGELFSDS